MSFEKAFDRMIANEGGFVLHKTENDKGGLTFAGISRRANPAWPGWVLIEKGDRGSVRLHDLVRELYRQKYWNSIRGDEILNENIASSVFDFAVNAGVRVASKLTQLVVGANPDGVIGPNSLAKINATGVNDFVLRYALAKIARYREICKRDPSQRVFLYNWITRALKEVQWAAS
jgi:lysozyme family protein